MGGGGRERGVGWAAVIEDEVVLAVAVAVGATSVTGAVSLPRFREAEAAPADATKFSGIERHDRMSR